MDDIDRKLLHEIQSDFPITQRPYKDLGVRLRCSEDNILRRIKRLKKEGIIRRIGGNFDSQRIGFITTLCAAMVPDDKIEKFVTAVNKYPGVTHNYLRDHHYNVWFTFVAPNMKAISRYIDEIIKYTGVREILNFPAVKTFKILVNFDLV
ncbi:MAG: AsnC family transcriptional regulator [Deltaproteobacteria bacterium]|nr:AsnC family transcriptional regulator [Deltaproteobacteria bacterium]MCD6266753.1 AsnC family transcriptional regulator [Deltaproteobacteria bacterium]RLB22622.1 MAG: Lrp/AsnC family transcriptional regulator [Deltaproteobacteria bacterium]